MRPYDEHQPFQCLTKRHSLRRLAIVACLALSVAACETEKRRFADTVAYVLLDEGAFTSRWEGATPLDPIVLQLRWRVGGWSIIPRHGLIGRASLGVTVQTSCDTSASRRRG